MSVIRVGPFRVSEVICAVLIFLCGMQTNAHAQSMSEPIAFEVATIKPAADNNIKGHGVHVELTRASYIWMSIQSLFTYAYGVGSFQIAGPKWMGTTRYDIEAKFPEGVSSDSERKMLQALLRDRFQLRFHVEKREEKVYALVPGKDGAKLKRSIASASEDSTPLRPGESIVGQGSDRHKELVTFDEDAKIIHTESSKMSMKDFARLLTSILHDTGNDTVVDRTGLEGDYQVTVDYPMATAGPGDDADASAPDPVGRITVKNSLDKVGLRLVRQNAQVDTYVIDHVERPSEN